MEKEITVLVNRLSTEVDNFNYAIFESDQKELIEKTIEIADKQTTEFAKWLENLTEEFYLKNQEASYSELLEIFKRERSETVA